MLLGAGGADQVRTPRLGDLDREMADPTRCGVDQGAIALPHSRRIHHGLPGGEAGERKAARVRIGKGVRGERQLPGRGGDEFGVGLGEAREPRHAEDAIAGGRSE